MGDPDRDSLRSAAGIAAGILLVLLSGCSSGSLASSTGPKPAENRWSTARRQQVHFGEEVRFDFVLQNGAGRLVQPFGLADYCATIIGNERIEAEADPVGHFQFSYVFDDFPPGATVKITTTAYQQRGGRDFMRIRGTWLPSDSPFNERDRKVATRASLNLTVYQATIDLTFTAADDDLDPETGVLRIRKSDGSMTAIYEDRPGRPGFTLTGPDANGRYHVRYDPDGRQLNPTGTTDVAFLIYDRAGQVHEASAAIDTP